MEDLPLTIETVKNLLYDCHAGATNFAQAQKIEAILPSLCSSE
ncbi:hypothetical protein [Bradyrhizobium sp. USDA 4504]